MIKITNAAGAGSIITPYRRMMMVIDGENLVRRFEALLKEGKKPREDTLYVPGSAVWNRSYSFLADVGHHDVIRATYYTSHIGSEEDCENLNDQVRAQEFDGNRIGALPKKLFCELFKRAKGTERSKGVDIKLTVDVLSHSYTGNFDTLLLMSGDGDFTPLVREVQRTGKQVYLSAFSSGLSSMLARQADAFYLLDRTAFLPK